MKKILLAVIIFTMFVPMISIAQTIEAKSAGEAKATALKSHIQKWGEATLTIKDDKGNVVLNETKPYPIVDESVKATVDFDNCWNFCREVCNGYGVCWVSCGWHCSPWTK